MGTGATVDTVTSEVKRKQLQILPSINMSQVEHDVTYFFASFLPMNTFHSGGPLVQGQLQDMMQTAPDLKDALCAVAALHRSLRARSMTATSRLPNPPDIALQLYGQSVRNVNRRIVGNTFAGDCSMLWTTFFLGLFEVCVHRVSKSSSFLTLLS